MLSDYFTKPLQGRMFHAYRDVIMGWKHISSLHQLTSSSIKERVEFSTQKSENINEIIDVKVSLDSRIQNPSSESPDKKLPNSESPHTSKINDIPQVTWADIVGKQTPTRIQKQVNSKTRRV